MMEIPSIPSILLKISNLCIHWGQKLVVDNLQLELQRGEALALIGESGCGKSSTAHALLRIPGSCGAVSGEIWFDGEPLHAMTEKQMQHLRGKKIGIVFQDPISSLNPTLKVGWQIAETLVIHKKMSWREAKEKTVALLEMVELPEPQTAFDMFPFQMSGGMLQRVAIAIALSCDPLLLIADEPTTALDVTVQAEILALLDRLRIASNMSLLLITHDLSIAWRICQRVAVMHRGKILEQGPIETVFSHPQTPYTALLCRSAQD
jgi:ABC-type dipeptide/oligopeptide/nickel transport system ATPase component